MSIDRSTTKLDAVPVRVLVRLTAERDAVLRGLVHALSNRVGTVGAVAGMLDPAAPAAGIAATVLHGEMERLETLLADFRLLTSERAAWPEPVHLPDLIAGVVALHAHHPVLRDVGCELVDLAALPPVLADPAAVADALLLMLGAAKAAVTAAGGGGAVELRGTLDGDAVLLRATGAGAGDDGGDEGLAWPLGDGGGAARIWSGGGSVRLPSLTAARAR